MAGDGVPGTLSLSFLESPCGASDADAGLDRQGRGARASSHGAVAIAFGARGFGTMGRRVVMRGQGMCCHCDVEVGSSRGARS